MLEDLVPQNIREALSPDNPLAKHHAAGMVEEMHSLWGNDVAEVCKKPANANIVGSRWVYAFKRPDEKEEVVCKARLVAQGFSQREGIDYDELFAPVASHTTVRAFLAMATYHDLDIRQIDVKTAFLYGTLPPGQEVYMRPPPGFPCPPGYVWKLKKALYGLKQAPRAWYQRLKTELEARGFTASEADPALFIKRDEQGNVVALIYVDDCLIAGRSAAELEQIISLLKGIFSIKDLGEPRDFLGINIVRDREKGTMALHQKPYIERILHKYGLDGTPPRKVPTPASEPEGLPLSPEQQLMYPSIVGSLIHLSNCTRPDIAFAVNSLARHIRSPLSSHWHAAIIVLKYLAGTADYALVFSRNSAADLQGYTDSDYAANKENRRSVTGYLFLLHGAAIAWQSRLQPTVALSSTEAEYMAAGAAGREALWLRKLLPVLGHKLGGPVKILGDNQAMLHLVKNPMVATRSKHIDITHHFVQERVASGQLEYEYVDTKHNWADQLTKGLDRARLEACVEHMGLKRLA